MLVRHLLILVCNCLSDNVYISCIKFKMLLRGSLSWIRHSCQFRKYFLVLSGQIPLQQPFFTKINFSDQLWPFLGRKVTWRLCSCCKNRVLTKINGGAICKISENWILHQGVLCLLAGSCAHHGCIRHKTSVSSGLHLSAHVVLSYFNSSCRNWARFQILFESCISILFS